MPKENRNIGSILKSYVLDFKGYKLTEVYYFVSTVK
jgi:hypothetical protein